MGKFELFCYLNEQKITISSCLANIDIFCLNVRAHTIIIKQTQVQTKIQRKSLDRIKYSKNWLVLNPTFMYRSLIDSIASIINPTKQFNNKY